jgi:16S rRNA C967 or C1407 C5-methylase (RsmB/RsmF family)
VLQEENMEQVKYFVSKFGLALSRPPRHALPQTRGMDGFFVAVFERNEAAGGAG